MQLSFLGKSYTAASVAVEPIITGETVTFMGQPYTHKHFRIASQPQPADLTYRGIHYTR